jgi:hypothetical protein
MLFKTITNKIFIFITAKNTSTKERNIDHLILFVHILFRSKLRFISNTSRWCFSIELSGCSRFTRRSFCIKLNIDLENLENIPKMIHTVFGCSRAACCCFRISRFTTSDVPPGFLPLSDGSLIDALK